MTDSNGNGQKDNPADTAKAAEPVISKPYIMPDDPEEGSAEALAKELAETRDKMLRTLAEMENLRKRTAREVADARACAYSCGQPIQQESTMTDISSIEAPRIYPTLRCKDEPAMMRWLKDVIGFTEYVVYRSDGVVQHAELAYGSSILMLGQSRDEEYGRLVGDIGGRRTDSLYVAVNDPDGLHAKAKAAGAKIEMELHNTDYGSRDFACRDPEGNLWSFGTYWPKVNEKPLAG